MAGMRTGVLAAGVIAMLILATGCPALRPKGEKEERNRMMEAGRDYVKPIEIPALSAVPAPEEYVRLAFVTNSNLQARYWEWRSAIERVPVVSSWPNVAVPFSLLLGAGGGGLWDRTTLGLANDPMTDIPYPTKLTSAGRRSLQEARAVGLRFEAARFELQRAVLTTCYDLALLGESLRIQEENVSLLRLTVRQMASRVGTAGGAQQELLKAQTDLDLAENELANLQSQQAPLAAKMNALIGRAASEPVPLPPALPAPRTLPLADDQLIQLGAERNQELAALARDVAGKREALTLAKRQRLPDFSLSASLTGGVTGALGGMVVLPTRREAIQAGIKQARAELQTARAAQAQYQRDLATSFVLNLVLLRNNERQIALFQDAIIPRARQITRVVQSAYASGGARYTELLDAQRTLLEARLTVAQLQMEREKALASIEATAAVDVAAMKSPCESEHASSQ